MKENIRHASVNEAYRIMKWLYEKKDVTFPSLYDTICWTSDNVSHEVMALDVFRIYRLTREDRYGERS